MPLFEVAITLRPTKNQAEEGIPEKILMPPQAVIASDIQSAGINAVLGKEVPPAVHESDKTRMQVHVRPFT